MKRFIVQHNVGLAKYVVSYHNGEKKYRDGSDFYDIQIFSNKKKLGYYIAFLKRNGYIPEQ